MRQRDKQALGKDPLEPGTVFRESDAPWCPELVVIPPGEFMMGSTEAEGQWAMDQGADREWVEHEMPQHLVRIAYPLAVGRFPVTYRGVRPFCDSEREKRRSEAWAGAAAEGRW